VSSGSSENRAVRWSVTPVPRQAYRRSSGKCWWKKWPSVWSNTSIRDPWQSLSIEDLRLKTEYLRYPLNLRLKIDEFVKSHSNDWIPACAGMTSIVSHDINWLIVIPVKAGIQINGKIRLLFMVTLWIYKPWNLIFVLFAPFCGHIKLDFIMGR